MRAARRTRRGFSSVGAVLEAAGVMAWFAVMVVGQRLVSDATTARRAAEGAASQTAAVGAATYCEDLSPVIDRLGDVGAQVRAAMSDDGKPDPGAILQLVAGLGIGQQPTFALFSRAFHAVDARARKSDVRAHAPVGDESYAFDAARALACPERSLDSIASSVAAYRASIFDTNIRGY